MLIISEKTIYNEFRQCYTSKTQLKADALRHSNVESSAWDMLSNREVIRNYGTN